MIVKQRIINGVAYFKKLKPSDFTVLGTTNPSRWYEFQEFLKLIEEYTSQEKQENNR